MVEEPTAHEAAIYMELCAALMNLMGVTEVELSKDVLPMSPFQIWRRKEGDAWIIRKVDTP